MKCNCKSNNCRKIIKSIRYLPDSIYSKYSKYLPRVFRKEYLVYHHKNFPAHGLIIKNCQHGYGLFANKTFLKNKLIVEINGKLFPRKMLSYLQLHFNDTYIQVGRNLFIGPSGELDDFICHSCSPNAYISINNKNIIIKSLINIRKDEEIMLDYSVTSYKDSWSMKCTCGFKHCRGIIRGFQDLPKNFQEKYINLSIVQNYILKALYKND